MKKNKQIEQLFEERLAPAPWQMWGSDLDLNAIEQMNNAVRLPVAHSGALMPDAHLGYGLPIGGVLATHKSVIPYAVGVDIACRVKITVLDLPVSHLTEQVPMLSKVLESNTRFGVAAHFKKPHDHEVMHEDWSASPIVAELKERAQIQLGTSGSGNHFVEFGMFTMDQEDLGLPQGEYVALLSHSGSRGAGAKIANHFSKLARKLRPELPPELKHLAWLDLDTEEGQEYWYAMELMGRYASANHDVIHREIVRELGVETLLQVENHHNYAWKEMHDGEELIVHRKGATPAGKGVLGFIPGTMADPGFLVRGKGNALSLESAAHGAGRAMSRTLAKQNVAWDEVQSNMQNDGITLLSAGADEAPEAYKNILDVMEHQSDLVEIVGKFDPKIVKMAPAGERPED